MSSVKELHFPPSDLPSSFSGSVHASADSSSKRIIDVIIALLGLIITAILLVPIAILMQLDSPGPIFYGQVRCGLRGRYFKMWKFRSMVVGADKMKHLIENQAKGHIFKNDCDPRVTRVGRFLRKTSLDEFPQFWNVLKGEMSIVGTRPPTPDEVAFYNQRHWKRLAVKPGITGEWQTHGRSSVEDFEDIVDLDLRYQRRWTVTYDLLLIWKTIWAVLDRRGAY
ncbi:MAG: sugar transferase [Microcoleaceae cyanobacterium]